MRGFDSKVLVAATCLLAACGPAQVADSGSDSGGEAGAQEAGGDAGSDAAGDVAGDAGAVRDAAGDAVGDDGLDASVDAGSDVVTRDQGADAPTTSDAGDADPCGPGFALCGAACRETASDPQHCGSCDNDCTMLYGVNPGITCSNGACVIEGACASGFADCDGDAGDGCETATTTVNNCGQCGGRCPGDPHGQPLCVSGACSVQCNAGYAPMGTACVLAPPRQFAPLSTATVTTQRPTLRWLLPATASSAQVEICRDRACAVPVTTFVAAGNAGAPAAALVPGTYFWRARSMEGTTPGAVASPTWEFTVGARSAAVDGSWGTSPDVNGDGRSDVLVTAVGTHHVFVYPGGTAGVATTPTTTLSNTGGLSSYYASAVASAGDVNGDGYADVLVASADPQSSFADSVFVYHGGPSGLPASPTASIRPAMLLSHFGGSISSAGDVNGDGYADVIVGAAEANGMSGQAYVYLGGPNGVVNAPATTLDSPAGSNRSFGVSVASAGDVNGDGYGDVIVGVESILDTSAAFVYLGGASGIGRTPSFTLTQSGLALGTTVAGAGDVNGDGFADVVIAGGSNDANHDCAAAVYLGGPGGLAVTPAVTITTSDGSGSWLYANATGVGDLDGDGYGEIALAAPSAASNLGLVHVYRGGAAGTATTGTTWTGTDTYGKMGYALAPAGDVNSDGVGDVVVGGADQYPATAHIWVYQGSAGAIPTSPTTTIASPDPQRSWFGQSVACFEPSVRPDRARPSRSAASAHPTRRPAAGHGARAARGTFRA